ncbi:MAG: C69 family dipeptidase [Planctomycetia bacterium]|nr:C69 family dipeptidase [Planctomycetia bacterium]
MSKQSILKITQLCCATILFLCVWSAPSYLTSDVAKACTNLIVTKGASAENACFITYTADSAGLFARLGIVEASDGSFKPDGGVDVFPEGYATHKVFGFIADSFQGVMNDCQVAMAETTWEGREELFNTYGRFKYGELMTATLQGASTAREAVELMGRLVAEYGYIDEGESISICDKNEAWIFDICGTGSTSAENNQGSVWVALRVPDGEITAHANLARIGVFPKDDPENCLYSPNVESFAIEKGLYDPNSGEPFSYYKAYGINDVAAKRVCEKRVWSIFRRAAPSLNLSVDYAQGVEGAEPYPWSIKPDHKLTVAEIAALMRDHYDGTEYDMSEGVDAGPYGYAMRCRPLYWEVDGEKYAWERPISTQQTGLSVITRSTSNLPDVVGGLVWFGWDDTYTTCYTPIYACSTALPPSTIIGTKTRFDIKTGWWTYNFVANYAYPRYKEMLPDIQAVQSELENYFYAAQGPIEKAATELALTNPELAISFLTDYSIMQTEKARERWEQLANDLLVKFNDGYTRQPDGSYPNVGYPEEWLRRVIKESGDRFRLPKEE